MGIGLCQTEALKPHLLILQISAKNSVSLVLHCLLEDVLILYVALCLENEAIYSILILFLCSLLKGILRSLNRVLIKTI